jgi:hypothetical protein
MQRIPIAVLSTAILVSVTTVRAAPSDTLVRDTAEEIESLTLSPTGVSPVTTSTATPDAAAGGFSLSLRSLGALSLAAEAAEQADPYRNYFNLKVGPLWFLDDLDDFDVGIYTEGVFGYRILRFLAVELASGYFYGEDPDGTVEAEAYGIPIQLQLRGTYWIRFLELYAGLGAGAYYIESEVDLGPIDDSESDWVFGGSAFLGVTANFGRLFVGVEGKYILTDDIDAAGGGTVNLEGVTVLGSFGVRF